MVNYIMPNYWSKQEFRTHFVSPIERGAMKDATEYAVQQMKEQSFVLVEELKNFVNR